MVVRRRVSSASRTSSRLPSLKDQAEKEAQAKQASALSALFKGGRAGRSMEELCQAFLKPIEGKDSSPAFSSSSITEAVQKFEPEGGEAASAETAGAAAAAFVEVVRSLGESAGMPFSELASQLLWRNRRAKVLQETHRRLTRDLSWLAQEETLEPVEEVFRCITAGGTRMNFRQWQKVLALIQRNPILQSKVKLSDSDRLFYGQCHHGGQANKNISRSEFKDLLFELAEASGIHPSLIFISVGSHARRLAGEEEDELEAAAAAAAASAASTSSVVPEPPTTAPVAAPAPPSSVPPPRPRSAGALGSRKVSKAPLPPPEMGTQ